MNNLIRLFSGDKLIFQKHTAILPALLAVLILLSSPLRAGELPCCAGKETVKDVSIHFPDKIGNLAGGGQEVYSGDKLYLLIDGEAEIFERYGYRKMWVKPYEGGGTRIQVQVSDMGNNLSAFGLFSYYTNRYGKFIKMGSNGFQEEHSIYFYQGNYFVQILHLKGKDASEAMKTISREISALIPGKTVKPMELEYFPRENLLDYTLRYIPKHFMGYSFLPPAFEARYSKNSDDVFRVFILLPRSNDEAEKCIKDLKEKQKEIILVSAGKYIAGAAGFKDKNFAEKLIKRIVEKIKKMNSDIK